MRNAIRHSEQRVVPFAREIFFNVVADVERYDRFLPWCTRSRILQRLGPLKFDAELSVGFNNLYHESYVSRVTLEPPFRVRAVMHSSPIIKTLTNDWQLEEVVGEPGKTLVKFDVSFEFRNSLHTAAAKLFFEQVHRRMLAAFMARAKEMEQTRKD
jgi:coenzyme Q-binding protein COQ10